jgi:hypothetical protein
MDSTACGIIVGLAGALPWLLLHVRRGDKPDAWSVLTLFGGLFSVPVAIAAMIAAIEGDTDQLPSKWREYVTVAALLGLYLTAEKVWSAYLVVLSKQGVPDDADAAEKLDDAEG